MKILATRRPAPDAVPSSVSPRLDRRSVVVAAGIAGAAAVTAQALRAGAAAPVPAAATSAAAAGAEEGYRLTPHVLRYYETTRS